MNIKLSPSELTYLFEGCKFCFYMKVKHGVTQPSMPMPGIFSAIAAKQEAFYANKRTEAFCPDLPPGSVLFGEEWVHSKEITFPGIQDTCHIRGRFDAVLKFDSGSYGVIDFKTASPSQEKANLYGRQLQAYAYALENPGPGKLHLAPVTNLGLIFFEPTSFGELGQGEQAFKGKPVWISVERNDQVFMDFLREVMGILGSVEPPKPSPDCNWCSYRDRMKNFNGASGAGRTEQAALPPSPTCPLCGNSMLLRNGKFGRFWSCQRYPACKGTRDGK